MGQEVLQGLWDLEVPRECGEISDPKGIRARSACRGSREIRDQWGRKEIKDLSGLRVIQGLRDHLAPKGIGVKKENVDPQENRDLLGSRDLRVNLVLREFRAIKDVPDRKVNRE